ncbi:hypothetical protein KUTeg_024094 [Tegillarca granosa]|uniref:Uncharacterized protein n=1 Tax=Tegillarca granosa TaxID=220873 RepID=A0ABQ9DWC0_TEGGR|nr:hypothetical protein KUTeg_024094 [Tegillarca granosa]
MSQVHKLPNMQKLPESFKFSRKGTVQNQMQFQRLTSMYHLNGVRSVNWINVIYTTSWNLVILTTGYEFDIANTYELCTEKIQ